MPKSRIPSPARSHTGLVTPRREKPRGPRSVGSPARSNASLRLTSVIQNFKDKNMDSFHLSPVNSRRSVLNDNTDIEAPKRTSWWKKLNDTSRDIMEVLENDKQDEAYNVIEEYMDVEVLSQEKKNHTLDLPDSSNGDSISSIIVPQRKLFTQKENQPKNKFAQLLGPRDTMATFNKTNSFSDKTEKTIIGGTKKLFGHSSKARSKPAFPAELLNFSPDKSVNKTAGEVKGRVRNLFGNRAGGVKRKNNFADFIASESEDEPEIQPKVFAFQKKIDTPAVRTRDASPTSSITTDIDMDDWKHLPSSTMVQTQLEAMITDTPAKKARLSKLSEGKESEAATLLSNKTKQSNKSVTSKNKSKMSMSKTSATSPKNNETEDPKNTSSNEVKSKKDNQNEFENEEVEMALSSNSKNPQVDNIDQNNANDASNRTNKSVTSKNKSKMSKTSPKANKSVEKSNVSLVDINVDEEGPNQIDIAKQIAGNQHLTINKSNFLSSKTLNKSKTSPVIEKSVQKSNVNETVPENEEQKEQTEDNHAKKNQNSSANKSKYPDKTVTNESKLSTLKASLNKSKTSPKHNKSTINIVVPEMDEQDMDDDDDDRMALTYSDEEPNHADNEEQSVKKDVSGRLELSNKSTTGNKSKMSNSKLNLSTTAAVRMDKNEHKSIINEAVSKKADQDIVLNDDGEIDFTHSGQDQPEIENGKHMKEIDNKDINDIDVNEIDTENAVKNNSQENVENDCSDKEDDNKQEDEVGLKAIESKEMEDGNQESEVEQENEEGPEDHDENQEMEDENKDSEIDQEHQESEVEQENEEGPEDPDVHDESQEMEDENQDSEVDQENENQESEFKQENEEGPEVQDESQEMEDENQDSEVDQENEDIEDEEEENKSQEIESEVEEGNQESENEEDEQNESQEVESDVPVETQEDDEPEENEEIDQQNQSEEIENKSQEVDNEESESEVEEENDDENVIDKSGGETRDNDTSQEEISGTEEGTPNVTHDTTGRNRKKDKTDVKSPEAVLHNKADQMESFAANNRNTSIRKTSMIQSLNIRPSVAPPRESTGLSDGTKNSSAEGSGWDSHRTTRKTLRKTFGRDFTPRKSLRALVMEKSAKRHTAVLTMNDVGVPEANSTELPADTRDVHEFEEDHDVSKRTRQTTLEMYLQKIKKKNMEDKKKAEEEVRNSLKAVGSRLATRDPTNPFIVPSRPFALKRVTKPAPKPKKTVKYMIPLEEMPQEFLEDMKYKPPKRFQPSNASWATKRLYKFLESKLEAKYDYKARIRAEKLVETIYNFTKEVRRHSVAPSDAVDVLKHEMARLNIVRTHFEFYNFFHKYMPREVRVKVNPDVINKIPLPRNGIFSDILHGGIAQG